MSEISFGQSVSKAFEFLASTFQDIDALLRSLTQQLSDAGWITSEPIRIPWGKIEYIYYGLYTPKASKETETCKHAILIQLQIGILDFCDEPIMLTAIVDFGKPVTIKSIWNAWKKEGGRNVMQHLLNNGSIGDIALDLFKAGFAPDAKQGFGIVVPICGVTSREEVKSRITDPLMNAGSQLGYSIIHG